MSHPDKRPLPTSFLRRVKSKGHLSDDGRLKPTAFEPDERTIAKREEKGWLPPGAESSINWEDDQDALPFTQKQAKGKDFCVARVDLEALRSVVGAGSFSIELERRCEPDNDYHGNVILPGKGPFQRSAITVLGLLASPISVPHPSPSEKSDSDDRTGEGQG